MTYGPALLMMPHIQKIVEGVHENGFKIFAQMDPAPGDPQPDLHRRGRGLGMFKTGCDGTMTRACINHHRPKTIHLDDEAIKDNGASISAFDFVLRGPGGVLNTLAWEGYREGYDDARHLAGCPRQGRSHRQACLSGSSNRTLAGQHHRRNRP